LNGRFPQGTIFASGLLVLLVHEKQSSKRGVRMSLLPRLRLTVLVLLLAALPGRAERKPYVPDRAHCQINFIGDSLLVSAHGFFEKWDGEFQLDRTDLSNSSIRLTIEAASLNTRVDRRDNHLRGPDFFDIARYPQVTFSSTKISRVDDSNYTLTGDLMLRGVTRSIDVPVRVVFTRDEDARFRGEMKLSRNDFGMTYNSKMNPIDDLVAVQFDIHLSDKEAVDKRQRQAP
jgi:polyisoprenoid-binding protein YceI